ncbi:hypothetical protein [Priestia megaterium]|uniref:hypothetical protein n=1 Tax=Priestia megaterium TaxID=1404 RepID=UPI003CC67052
MNTREYKHEHNELLCYKCDTLQEDKSSLIEYHMCCRGYGSSFDNDDFTVQICHKCNKPEYEKWFNEEYEKEDYHETYKHEGDIIILISSFPIENQEYIENDYMERQDWIDMKKGILPDEKYEEYGMSSPRQINTYKERFTTCEHPVNAVFNDKSKACYCPFGATGKYDQIADEWNISTECFGCQQYEKRSTVIKEMDYDKFQRYKQYMLGKLYRAEFE